MKRKTNIRRRLFLCVALTAVFTTGLFGLNRTLPAPASAEETTPTITAPMSDPSPALYIAEKNTDSVVGILTNNLSYNAMSMTESSTNVAQGSGVVIAEGGYVLTNNHVIESGKAYQILLHSGDKVDATLVGTDTSTDLAVLKVSDETVASNLKPVTFAEIASVKVGSTVIAIGNPGGEILANTVTQGIVSALERTEVTASNTSRRISYIQHDAAINSGNSGGGLFNCAGELIGINTLKYSGSAYSGVSYEGLGFAIPADTAKKVAFDLIEYGKVRRPGLGVTVSNYEGAEEPLQTHGPSGILVNSVTENGAAAKAGMQQYDFITAVDGQRVYTRLDLTSILDNHEIGDTITVTVVRYATIGMEQNPYYGNGYSNNPFGGFFNPFGGYGYGYGYGYGNGSNDEYGNGSNNGSAQINNGTLTMSGGYETIDLTLTLELLD